jgi:hypothetical protein
MAFQKVRRNPMLSRLVFAALLTVSGATIVAAQGEVTIPSDAQLERMEERAITTNPLDDRGAPAVRGGEEAENLQMDRRAHRIDERLIKDGGICTDCK